VRPYSIIRTLAVAALVAVPSLAMAAPDQNAGNHTWNNGCHGQWVNGQCVTNSTNQNNNGRWNNDNDQQHRDWDRRERERIERERLERERWQREHAAATYNNGYNNGYYNNGYNNGYYNGGYYNGGYYNGGYYNGGYYNGGVGNGYGYGGYNNGRNQLTATVSSFSPYNLFLTNGLHVVLHDGTVINPRGTNLTGGQRVRITGHQNGDGTFTADEIDVIGNGYYGR
jgi:hypothetical protein